MRKKLLLSITASSLALLTASSVFAGNNLTSAEQTAPQTVSEKKPHSYGKCAIGKCGNEKMYKTAKTPNNTQDRLVRARDGKCGISGAGETVQQVDPKSIKPGKCASGLCGV